MHGRKAVEAFHEPQESEVHSRAESGGAPPHSKTLARWLWGARTSARFSSAPLLRRFYSAIKNAQHVAIENALAGSSLDSFEASDFTMDCKSGCHAEAT